MFFHSYSLDMHKVLDLILQYKLYIIFGVCDIEKKWYLDIFFSDNDN